MRYSQMFMPTLKEAPAEAQVASHILMVRGGFIRKLAAGVYTLLPLGQRVIHKVETIIREELDRAGAQEIFMPSAIPAELWQESGRWEQYGPELLRWKDRKGADFCTGPTHEEVVVDLVRRDVSSHKQLPQNLYQIQSKFRDEMRPRAGVMRGREFIMKDAYSFDVDDEAAKLSYDKMYEAYQRIFKRCGLDFRAVEADTGNIGGSLSHEFQVLATSGEDAIVACTGCDYAANVEMAAIRVSPATPATSGPEAESVSTPDQRTISDVAAFLKVEERELIKTLLFRTNEDRIIAAVLRGDRDLAEAKLKRATGAGHLELASEEEVQRVTGCPPGFAGPVGIEVPLYVDHEVAHMQTCVAGANRADTHLRGVVPGRDMPTAQYVDLRNALEGDSCPRCEGGSFATYRGIEVGHVFFLGTKYSKPMGCTFLDHNGKTQPMVMGCYGIGVTRTAAAAIEQNHDEGGIVWPMAIAPFQVCVLVLQAKDDEVMAAGVKIYEALRAAGFEVLLDDRKERPGSKFKDADLVGIPLRIAVGKNSLEAGQVELKHRREADATAIGVDAVVATVQARIAEELGSG